MVKVILGINKNFRLLIFVLDLWLMKLGTNDMVFVVNIDYILFLLCSCTYKIIKYEFVNKYSNTKSLENS